MKRSRRALMILAVGVASPAWAGAVPCWKTQLSHSTLGFVGRQAGAPASGRFKSYKVDFCFSPSGDKGGLRVTVDLSSVDTRNPTRDGILRGKDFFDVARYARAVYSAHRFKAEGGGRFKADGVLKLHGVSKQVPVVFGFHEQAGGQRAQISGTAVLNRQAFGIGRGQWGSTRWVAARVKLHFDLKLARAGG